MLKDGYILFVNADVCEFRDRPEPWGKGSRPAIPFDRQIMEELRWSNYIAALTPEGYPPLSERKCVGGWKCGWTELKLPDPGLGAYYLRVQ